MNTKTKKRLTTILIIFAILLYFYSTYWIGTGLSTNPNVGLLDFTVSEDGSEITLKTTVISSAGYIRDFSPMEVDTVQYVDFYCTFGGVNSTFGAKDEFIVKVNENCQGIYFQREDGYELVLFLNPETNQWEKVTPVAE